MRRRTPRRLRILQCLVVVLWLLWGASAVWSLEIMSPKSSVFVTGGCVGFTWKWPSRLREFLPSEYMMDRSDAMFLSIWPKYKPSVRSPASGAMLWPVLIVPLWLLVVPLTIIVVCLRRRRRALDGAPTCARCEFNLTGNASGVCPECGAAFEMAQV
ncbi:MAG TPA: hypothetical protein P5081_00480 [Phycisphaerae bacterium]|nr:hypothetical protein [Phycisphaerae bacterium]HRW51329.1 hypothetical protein [Phycisphaerae bacterium]